MAKPILTKEDDDLLSELGVEVEAKKAVPYTPTEERIIAGFQDIERFFKEHGRIPQHGEERDIFERLYAVRLDKIRTSSEYRSLLQDMDAFNLLADGANMPGNQADSLDDDALLAELGVAVENDHDITQLKHVRSRADVRTAEEIAKRTPCKDFPTYQPLFEAVGRELANGIRKTTRFRKDAGFAKTDIKKNQFLIMGGQTAYIADVGETLKAPNGEDDARLRVIYSNATESDILLRSLIRAMYKDETSRLISDLSAGPLFSDQQDEDDIESGIIYVLRSHSNDPYIQQHRDIIHKIGVTGGDINKRFTNAKNDATFLMADVEVVATYKLSNINRVKLENLIHKFFDSAKLDIEVKDRFGKPIVPREWFLVPLFVIDEMVEKVKEGTIINFTYNTTAGKIVKTVTLNNS